MADRIDDLIAKLRNPLYTIKQHEFGSTPDIDIATFQAERNEAADALTAAQSENDRLRARVKELELSAKRWDALMECPRIRMFGSAGVDAKTGERTEANHVHFEAGFWSDSVDDGPQSGQFSTTWGKHALAALADALIDIRAAAKAMETK
jgi:hypothetical protein